MFTKFILFNTKHSTVLLHSQRLLFAHIGQHQGDVGGQEVVHLVAQGGLAEQFRAADEVAYNISPKINSSFENLSAEWSKRKRVDGQIFEKVANLGTYYTYGHVEKGVARRPVRDTRERMRHQNVLKGRKERFWNTCSYKFTTWLIPRSFDKK